MAQNTSPAFNPQTFGVTVVTKAEGILTKSIYMNGDGRPHSDGTACVMTSGQAQTVRLGSVAHLADLINGLTSNQALTLGVVTTDPMGLEIHGVLPRAELAAPLPGVIARSRDYISYQRADYGFMLIDFDQKGMPDLLEIDDPVGTILDEIDGGEDVPHVFRTSTSSGLTNTATGETYGSTGGFHLYLPVQDASDIPCALKVLHKRLWLAGYGWHVIGSRGQLLERSMVDTSVGGPEGLIFEGPPMVSRPLVQDVTTRAAQVGGGSIMTALDTRAALPDLTEDEEREYRLIVHNSRIALAHDVKHAQQHFVQTEAQRTGRPQDDIRADLERALGGRLPLAHMLYFDDPQIGAQTVETVVNNLDAYIGQTLGDPLDPDDGRGKAKIMGNGFCLTENFFT